MTMKPSILHPSELVKRIRVHSDADAFEVQKLEFQLAEARSLVKVHEAFDIACSAPSSIEALSYMPGLRQAEKLLRENGFEKSAKAIQFQINVLAANPEADKPVSATLPLKKAAELLRFNAGLIRESATAGDDDANWCGEDESEADYRELIATAQALEPFDEGAWWQKFVAFREAELFGTTDDGVEKP